jgi:hypothetical protein
VDEDLPAMLQNRSICLKEKLIDIGRMSNTVAGPLFCVVVSARCHRTPSCMKCQSLEQRTIAPRHLERMQVRRVGRTRSTCMNCCRLEIVLSAM